MKRPSPSKFAAIAYILVFAIAVGCTKGLIHQGDKKYDSFAYSQALDYYKRAAANKPNDPDIQLKLADTYRMLHKPESAKMYYETVDDTVGLPTEDRLNFAKMLMENNDYGEAEEQLKTYLEENPDDVLAQDLLMSSQKATELKEDTSLYILTPIPLQNAISMFGPTPYGQGLVVAAETEIYSAATTNPWTGYSYLDLYYMEQNNNGEWMAPEPFDFNLNSRFHDGPATFNDKGDKVIFTRSNLKKENKREVTLDNVNNFALFISEKDGEKWSEPKPMPFNDPSYSVGHPALSPDGNTLYFSSDMPGGYGGSDIYKSTYDGEKWSEPINLGETINTPGNEVFPFAKSEDHIYFSSEGHQTLGGLDIQEAIKSGSTWSEPRNLAYPINSSRDDFSIVVSEDDTTGYVSSNRSDIDMVYEWVKVPPVLFVEGMAKKKADGMPVEGAKITLKNLTDESEQTFTTDADGEFKLFLSPNTDYKIFGEKGGYFTQSYDISTGEKSQEETLDLVFEMDEIVESPGGGEPNVKTYDVGNVYYDYDESHIRKDAEPVLNKLVRLLQDNPDINIELQSHTDCRGSNAYNDRLSRRRANSVIKYLKNKGIDKKRLDSRGFGETKPKVECPDCENDCSEEEHQENRRTEFIVLSKADK